MADFLVALADFDRKRLWLALGYSSLFHFLHRELGLSKGAAHYRKVAAELVQKVPGIVEPLRDGRLCITSVVHLAKVLTPENRDEMLPRFFHRSRHEAMEIAAAIRPVDAAPHRDVVTSVPMPADAAGVDAEPRPAAADLRSSAAELTVDPAPVCAPIPEPPPRPVPSIGSSTPGGAAQPRSPPRRSIEPLTAELSRLHVTVSRRFLEKLEAARAALSHSRPGATAEEILEAGLDLVLARDAKRKGVVENPMTDPPPSTSDRVPAHVRRAVWIRDGGRCQWPVDRGGVCGSTLRLQLDHIVPRARGGPSSVENVRILCQVHNDLAARHAFGDLWMDRFTRKRTDTEPVARAE